MTMLRQAARPLLLALAVLAGCSAGQARSAERLHLASRNYQDALQFGDFQVVAQLIEPGARTDFLARAYGMEESLSVLESVPIATEVAPDGETARMILRVSWYELPSTVVRTENVFLQWKRLGDDWFIAAIEGGPLPLDPPAD